MSEHSITIAALKSKPFHMLRILCTNIAAKDNFQKIPSFIFFRLIRLNTVSTLAEEYGNINIFGINFTNFENKNIASYIFISDLFYKLNIFI